MNKNILTILSALLFLVAIILPICNSLNIPLFLLIITSLFYKYMYIYHYNTYKYIFWRKLDQIAISYLIIEFKNLFFNSYKRTILKNIILSIAVNMNFKLFSLFIFIMWSLILYKAFTIDIFIFSLMIISTLSALSFYKLRLLYGWKNSISWVWHNSILLSIISVMILSQRFS